MKFEEVLTILSISSLWSVSLVLRILLDLRSLMLLDSAKEQVLL